MYIVSYMFMSDVSQEQLTFPELHAVPSNEWTQWGLNIQVCRSSHNPEGDIDMQIATGFKHQPVKRLICGWLGSEIFLIFAHHLHQTLNISLNVSHKTESAGGFCLYIAAKLLFCPSKSSLWFFLPYGG